MEAQNIIERNGCGTGCVIFTKQISELIRMDNGYRRVLVETITMVAPPGSKGFRPCSPGDRCGPGKLTKVWVVADCNNEAINSFAFNSDGSDGRWMKAYRSDGTPANSGAEGNAYYQWQLMCSVP